MVVEEVVVLVEAQGETSESVISISLSPLRAGEGVRGVRRTQLPSGAARAAAESQSRSDDSGHFTNTCGSQMKMEKGNAFREQVKRKTEIQSER